MVSAFERSLPGLARKPRLLVCAPSNAAADELLGRVMADGFCDGGGQIYRPSVVRIGKSNLLFFCPSHTPKTLKSVDVVTAPAYIYQPPVTRVDKSVCCLQHAAPWPRDRLSDAGNSKSWARSRRGMVSRYNCHQASEIGWVRETWERST